MYYKAVKDGKIIDAYDFLSHVRYDAAAGMILRCAGEDTPQGIIQRNGMCIYHVDGWEPFPEEAGSYGTVELQEIPDADTYLAIIKALKDDEEIPDVPEPEPDPGPDEDINFVKNSKVRAMSAKCEQTIVEGVTVTLTDGKVYRFALNLSDQIMIDSLANRAKSGENALPYHADGEQDRFFSTADILTVKNAMDAHVLYNRTYFNSLREYIEALEDAVSVSEIQYGVEIPDEYQSDVLKAVLSGNLPESYNISAGEALQIITGGAE